MELTRIEGTKKGERKKNEKQAACFNRNLMSMLLNSGNNPGVNDIVGHKDSRKFFSSTVQLHIKKGNLSKTRITKAFLSRFASSPSKRALIKNPRPL